MADGRLEVVLTGVGGGTLLPAEGLPAVGVVVGVLVRLVTVPPFSPTLCRDEVEELGLLVPVDPSDDLGLGLGEIPGLFPPFTALEHKFNPVLIIYSVQVQRQSLQFKYMYFKSS